MRPLLITIMILLGGIGRAQSVGIGTASPAASAILDLQAPNKGFLMPVLTTAQRNAIPNPATGLQVYDKEKGFPYFFNGTTWVAIGTYLPKDVPPAEVSTGNASSANGLMRSVAISNNFAASGRPDFDTAATDNIGSVDIYQRINGRWVRIQRLLAPDTSVGADFGYSLDMDYPYLVAGACSRKVGSFVSAGKAYVFRHNTGTNRFELDGQFTSPAPETAGRFGWSASITTNTQLTGGVAVAIGAPSQGNSGAVSVFRRGGANNYIHTNTISGRKAGEDLGTSVDIEGNFLMSGAPEFDTTISGNAYNGIGRVQVNRYISNTYSNIEAQLYPGLAVPSSTYGHSVKIHDDVFAVTGRLAGSDVAGYPTIYRRISLGNFTVIQNESNFYNMHEPDEEGPMEVMGYTLALSAELLIVGVPHNVQTTIGGSNSSRIDYVAIYKFDNTLGKYVFYTKHANPYGQKNSKYGISVACSGTDYIIAMGGGTTQDGSYGGVYFGNSIE